MASKIEIDSQELSAPTSPLLYKGTIGCPLCCIQVVKLAGYDLCANRSGKTSDQAVPVISKNGNGELRYVLYIAANVAASRTEPFRTYFTKMLQGRERERGIKTKMRVKLAAKMLVIAWTLMKKKEVFDPDHLNID
ncbi:transposase [Thermodesulfobacteriota bacterium]